MSAHDDAMPEDLTDAEAFHLEGEFDGIKLPKIVLTVCELCLSGYDGSAGTLKGEEECHTPGCAFWMDDAPKGRTLALLRQWVGRG